MIRSSHCCVADKKKSCKNQNPKEEQQTRVTRQRSNADGWHPFIYSKLYTAVVSFAILGLWLWRKPRRSCRALVLSVAVWADLFLMSVYFRIYFETTIFHLLKPIIFTHDDAVFHRFIFVLLQNLFLISRSDTANPVLHFSKAPALSRHSLWMWMLERWWRWRCRYSNKRRSRL